MKAIQLQEQIWIIPGFLSQEECAQYIGRSEHAGFKKAKVQTGTGQRVVESVRNNERVIFTDFELAENLWERAKPFVPGVIGNYTAIGLNEMFRIYRYKPGQTFRRHRDGSFIRNETESSFYTFMIYLNQDFQGGDTSFNNTRVKPMTGMALIFLHDLEHTGETVTAGTKYALRTDVMYRFNPPG